MLIALWIINAVLALLFLAAGGMKAVKSKAALAESGMGWTEDYSAASIRLIGIAEVLGALGLILPLATGIAPILTPIAAAALAVIMIGATATHARRKEPVAQAAIITVLCVASAVAGFLAI